MSEDERPYLTPDPALPACERCGRLHAAVELRDHHLCEECYYLSGSCCLEFGSDDLWTH